MSPRRLDDFFNVCVKKQVSGKDCQAFDSEGPQDNVLGAAYQCANTFISHEIAIYNKCFFFHFNFLSKSNLNVNKYMKTLTNVIVRIGKRLMGTILIVTYQQTLMDVADGICL